MSNEKINTTLHAVCDHLGNPISDGVNFPCLFPWIGFKKDRIKILKFSPHGGDPCYYDVSSLENYLTTLFILFRRFSADTFQHYEGRIKDDQHDDDALLALPEETIAIMPGAVKRIVDAEMHQAKKRRRKNERLRYRIDTLKHLLANRDAVGIALCLYMWEEDFRIGEGINLIYPRGTPQDEPVFIE